VSLWNAKATCSLLLVFSLRPCSAVGAGSEGRERQPPENTHADLPSHLRTGVSLPHAHTYFVPLIFLVLFCVVCRVVLHPCLGDFFFFLSCPFWSLIRPPCVPSLIPSFSLSQLSSHNTALYQNQQAMATAKVLSCPCPFPTSVLLLLLAVATRVVVDTSVNLFLFMWIYVYYNSDHSCSQIQPAVLKIALMRQCPSSQLYVT
jgi:hypothetical protein